MAIDVTEHRSQIARRSDLSGSERRALLSDAVDAWLRQLFAEAVAKNDSEQFCLVAIGGYGRREMSMRSDIDVLMLHDPRARGVGDLCSAIWYPVWDSGIPLDHSVRTIAQARTLAREDYKVMLGLLDARPIAGNAALAESLRSGILGDWRAGAADRLGELHATVTARRSRAGDLAQLLEPDLKESFGGLRDAVVLRALAASWVVEVPRTTWPDAVRTLLDVRDELHARGRRDRLSMQDQAEIAEALAPTLGCRDSDELLRSVYLAAREIAYASDVAWYRALRATKRRASSAPRMLRRLTGRRASAGQSTGPERIPLAEGVVLVEGEIGLARGVDPVVDRGLELRAAAAAAQASVLIGPGALERFAANGESMGSAEDAWTSEMRQSWISLLGAGPSLVPVMESLDQSGILQRWIPAWEAVRSLPQHNPIHEFTVDRHLLETTVHAATRAREVERPDLLLVAAFLHDIGKGYPGDHSVVGEPIARDIALHMGFSQADAQTIALLVRVHLLLPDVATRRDLDDPGTIDLILDAVPDARTLELLHSLTWADAEATGPAVRSDWRRGLIRDLVQRCMARLGGEALDDESPFSSLIQEALSAQGDTSVRLVPAEDGCSILVSTPERVGVLSLVAGVLSLHRLQIRGARVATEGSRAAQEWHVRPLFGDLPDERAIASDVRSALAGDLDVADRLRRRTESTSGQGSRGAKPVVLIDRSPTRHTVVEVRAHDEPMLLYRITSALRAADAVVVGAKVDTLGSEVVDAFFVTDRQGAPLGADHAEAVRATVQATVLAAG